MAGLHVEQFEIGSVFETFPKPVFAGDTIRSRTTVLEKRNSRSRPDSGIVTFLHEGVNQSDEIVCRCTRQALMLRKPAG
jgi:acyl dehydratase